MFELPPRLIIPVFTDDDLPDLDLDQFEDLDPEQIEEAPPEPPLPPPLPPRRSASLLPRKASSAPRVNTSVHGMALFFCELSFLAGPEHHSSPALLGNI